jgi:hypothetical protein
MGRYPKIIVATLIIILFIGEFAHCRLNSLQGGGKDSVSTDSGFASVGVMALEPPLIQDQLQETNRGVR